MNEFGFSAEMLNEKDKAVETVVAAPGSATVNGHPLSIRELDTQAAGLQDTPPADSEDGIEAAKTGAWKSQKQKSKKAKKID